MAGGYGNIKPEDGKQFSKEYQPKEKWTEKNANILGEELIEWLKEKDEHGEDKGNIFFMEFLVIEKKMYPALISYLKDKFTSFFKLIEQAEAIQEIKLQKYGVGDRLNSTMTKFVLINKHGWKDKTDITTNGENISTDSKTAKDIEEIKNRLRNSKI